MKGPTLAALLAAMLGLALWGGMLWLTSEVDSPSPLLIHLGETGATLAVLVVIGGLVSAAFTARDESRRKEEGARDKQWRKEEAKHEFYRGVLADLKSVYDRVERCRLLIEAHRSAKTYGEQVRGLVASVVTLHNIKRALNPEFPKLREELREPIEKMTAFIKGLLNEFRDKYRRISHLQAADEAWNKHARETLPREKQEPGSYKPVARAWAEVQKLPKLAVLRDDDNFGQYETEFLKHLDEASRTLRRRLPVDE